MDYKTLSVDLVGPVVRISLNRPDVANAQNTELLDELDDALTAAARDDSVRVVILAGKGKHFSAGHDLKVVRTRTRDLTIEERWDFEGKYYFDFCLKLWDFPKPTIAQVQGACVAGGFMLANMCDLIVAADNAFFADPLVHSMAGAAVEVLIHPWVLGARKAKEILYTGRRLTAAEAHACGMVNRVVGIEQLDAESMALANRIAEAPPFALRLMKKSLNQTLDIQGMRNALANHFNIHTVSHATEEWKRGVAERSSASIEPVKPGQSASDQK